MSLENHDGNGKVTRLPLKNEYALYIYESRDTLKLFTWFITVKTIAKMDPKQRDKFEPNI